MRERNKAEVLIAVFITIFLLIGMTMIGLKTSSNLPGELVPLLNSGNAQAYEQRMVTTNGSATPLTANTKTSLTPNPSPSPALSRTPIRIGANTPTPIRVIVGTQKRSWVFYHGPAAYVRGDAFAPLPLSSFPRPANDNGRGLHWFPTTRQTRAVVDRFVPELRSMKIRWLVILQGMNDWDLIANDYLVDRLNAEGIMVVMRIDRRIGTMDWKRLGWIVARHRERGVRYFQVFNEPNADEEWSTDAPHSPEQFAAYWIQAAEVIAANGGLPGFAPMSPQSDDSDLVFFQAALEELKRLGRYDLVNMMWLAVHNYGDFDVRNQSDDGFFRYRSYDAVARKVFGGGVPIIMTEGGMGDAESMISVIAQMYRYVTNAREPYLLSFSPWLIGNAVGGGHDPRWEIAAWFTGTLNQVHAKSVVNRVRESQ